MHSLFYLFILFDLLCPQVKLGMWVDLTNTTRFYDKTEIDNMDCKYVKMQCRGHGETPSLEQTRFVITFFYK